MYHTGDRETAAGPSPIDIRRAEETPEGETTGCAFGARHKERWNAAMLRRQSVDYVPDYKIETQVRAEEADCFGGANSAQRSKEQR